MKHSEKAINTYYKDNKTVNKEKGKRKEPVFNLKVSESEKYKDDCEWFKDYAEWIVPAYSSTIDNYKEMKLAYDLYNDNLDGYKQELDKFCNALGENVGSIEEEIQPYPKLHNKVNIIKGELINRNDTLKVVLLSAKAIKDKNKQLIDAIKLGVEEEVVLEIEKMQMELEGKSPEEVQKYIDGLRQEKSPDDLMKKDFKSEWEIFYSKALKFCKFDQNVKSKKVETMEDVIIADRCFIYSGWKNGKPYLEIRNPLYTGFQKAPNEMMVHKGDYNWYKKPITIADAYKEYGDKLNDDELEEVGIRSHDGNYRIDKRHSLGPNDGGYVRDTFNESVFRDMSDSTQNSSEDKSVGLHQGQGINRRESRETLIWETHIEFMAFKELIFLSYKDDYNDFITVVLSSDFDIPDHAEKEPFTNKWGQKSTKYTWIDPISGTEYTAEKLYIPRKYEVIRLGDHVYPVCREVPFQSTNLENPYTNFTLSMFGAIFTSRNAKSISLFQRAIPAYFQFLYVKHIQNRELAKYQGYIQSIDVDQIPQQLGQDIDGNIIRDPMAVWMLYRKKYGLDLFSGSQSTLGGAPPATRSPGSSGYLIGTAAEIFHLQQLLEFIDREIGMAMGISPQRESQFSNNSNVMDNQQAIQQSHHITEPYFFYLDQVWKDVLSDYLKNFRTFCQNKLDNGDTAMFHYVLDDGTEELLNVTPKMLEMQDIGLFVANSVYDRKYNEMMMQLVHAFAQNAGEGIESVSAILKAITSNISPEETHKIIRVEADKQSERSQQMERTKLEVQEEYIAREKENREDIQAHEIEKEHVKGKYMLEKAAIDLYKFTEDKDKDGDGQNDALEAYVKMRKLDQDDVKLQQGDKKLEIDKEKVKVSKMEKKKPKK